MRVDTLLVIRCLILIASLAAFYRLWMVTRLVMKVSAWLIFQACVILLWLSASYRFHGQLNPFPQAVAFVIGVFSIGILFTMLIFAIGALRRQGSSKNENSVGDLS